MFARPYLSYLLLVSTLLMASTGSLWARSKHSDLQPVDSPVKECDEEKEAFGKSEASDNDASSEFVGVDVGICWNARTSALQEIDVQFCRRVFLHGPDHSRAPPACLL